MPSMSRMVRFALLSLLMVATAGCATVPEDAGNRQAFADESDPLEPLNRSVFAFNQGLRTVVIRPVTTAYRAIFPSFVRGRVHDFLFNLRSPVILANNLLQGDIGGAASTVGRFSLNSTFGVLGLMDVAQYLGLPPRDEDFGQTLAVWGIGEGAYLVLPIAGPSNVRDTFGLLVEAVTDPLNVWAYTTDREWIGYTRAGAVVLDTADQTLDTLDEVERTSLDFYAALRSLYRQNRRAQIRNETGLQGIEGLEDYNVQFDMDVEFDEGPAAPERQAGKTAPVQ